MITETTKNFRNEELILLAAQILAKDHKGVCLKWNEVVFDQLYEPTFYWESVRREYIAVIDVPISRDWAFRGTMGRYFYLDDGKLKPLDLVGGI